MSYLQTVTDVYAEAARQPDDALCCTSSPVWRLPDLRVPPLMLQMNYGCGSTVDPRDVHGDDTILYVGVGGGLEALQSRSGEAVQQCCCCTAFQSAPTCGATRSTR